MKIADFGTTKVAGPGARTPLTTFTGTPNYLAPEILYPISVNVGSDAYEYTNLVDIWSLGCLVYTMATKYPPFSGDRELTQYTSGKSPFPDKGLETELRRFIISLMQPLPQDRPTATEALKDPWLQPDADTWPWAIGGDLQSMRIQIQPSGARPIDRNAPVIEGLPYLEPNPATVRSQIYPPHRIVLAKPEMRALPLEGRLGPTNSLQNEQVRHDRKLLQLGTGKSESRALVASDTKRKPLSGGKLKPSAQEHIKCRSLHIACQHCLAIPLTH